MKIKCSTLFDITKTNISTRRGVLETSQDLVKQRNQQSNFETLLQIISLRSQPENITEPIKNIKKPSNKFGQKYKTTTELAIWEFTFTVDHSSIFKENDNELGLLFRDCEGVPMILGLEETNIDINQLCIDKNNKNINFEKVNE